MRKFLLVIGVISIILSVGFFAYPAVVADSSTKPEIITAVPSTEVLLSSPTPFQPQYETEQPTVTATPPLVQGYNLNGVDLSSGLPIALLLGLPDGSLLPSVWENSVSYRESDPEDIFAPDKGIVYSYEDSGLPVTWAHAGANPANGQPLFADNFDRWLHKTDGWTLSLTQAQAKAQSLVGLTAVLCQDESGTIKPMSAFDPGYVCTKKVTLEVVAFVIVPHELVPGYDALSNGIWPWMVQNFPDTGFESLSASDSWMLRFCVGEYYDQKNPTQQYFYNRGVIAFRIRE